VLESDSEIYLFVINSKTWDYTQADCTWHTRIW